MPPFDLTIDQALWASAILLLAFFVRGIVGFGSGLIAIPLLALMLPLPLVVPIVALLDYGAALLHGVHHRRKIRWPDLLPLLPFTLTGSLVALYLLHQLDTALLAKLLGGFVMGYALYTLVGKANRRPHSRLWAAPLGAIGGLISTLFGTGGPFYVIYLHLRGLDQGVFRATVSAIFMIDGGIRIIGYATTGLIDETALTLTLAGIPLMLLAMCLGGRTHTNLPPATFTRLISVLLLGSGLALLLR